ncbi:polysaccharide pyruvyl transferase family protein [Planctomycetota bacterium]
MNKKDIEMQDKRPLFILAGNGSYLNRGCEAIVRGTAKIIRETFDHPLFLNIPFDINPPYYLPEEKDPGISHRTAPFIKRWSPKWIVSQLFQRTLTRGFEQIMFRSIKEDVCSASAVLSIGGDLYSLDYGVPKHLLLFDRYVRHLGKPLIIWGASIGPFDKEPRFARVMHRHLKEEVSAIFVREERSLEYLEKCGIRDNVCLMSDPAFLMESEHTSTGELSFDIEEGSIGLNLSPLMARYVGDNSRENLICIAKDVIEALHKKTDRSILLIPHVTSPYSNDYELLEDIQGRLNPDYIKHVHLVPKDLNAAKTKWIISKVSCLIASRTHATIAAFSSCVPTVSLAYSVKAYGLNEMLFGHSDFVVRPDDIHPDKILEKAEVVLGQNKQIRKQLESSMQDIRNLAFDAGTKLRRILKMDVVFPVA